MASIDEITRLIVDQGDSIKSFQNETAERIKALENDFNHTMKVRMGGG